MIYIITPVFNRRNFTEKYLEALEKQTNKNFKTIIVDDGSTDGTSDMIKEKFPNVIVLKEKGDLWWAEATNIGVKYALSQGADYIMTLNDDTVPYEDYIEKMYYWMQKEPDALLGAFAVDANSKKPIFGGEILNWKTTKFENLLLKYKEKDLNGLKEVNIFPGRGLLIPKKIFDTVGYYDSKNFPQTVADIDFTCRAYNKGFKIYCNYDAKIQIFPDESGGVTLVKKRSLRNYYNHLFGIRGGGNVIWFTKFALKNAPFIYLPSYLIIGLLKRFLVYPFRWLKESMK